MTTATFTPAQRELVRLVLGYQPQASWDVQLGGEYGRNPEFPRRFEGFLRFTFRF